MKSAPPDPPGLVVVGGVDVPPPVLLGVVGVGVAVPPVLDEGVGVGVTAVPPVFDELVEELGVAAVVDVVVVDVVVVDAELAAGVVVPPDGGAVSAGVVFGTL